MAIETVLFIYSIINLAYVLAVLLPCNTSIKHSAREIIQNKRWGKHIIWNLWSAEVSLCFINPFCMTEKLIIIICCCLLFSCKKNDDTAGNNTTPNVALNCRITRIETDASNYTAYTYDASERITEINIVTDDIFKTSVYNYGNTPKVMITAPGSAEVTEITLDSNGNAKSRLTSYYTNPDLETVFSLKNINYVYNAEGYLIRADMVSGDKNGNIFSSSTTSYTWTDGNLTLEAFLQSPTDPGSRPSITTYTYYSDKPNAFAFMEKLSDFTGKKSKNLLKSTIQQNDTSSFSYVFNASGTPVKMNNKIAAGTFSKTVSWVCP